MVALPSPTDSWSSPSAPQETSLISITSKRLQVILQKALSYLALRFRGTILDNLVIFCTKILVFFRHAGKKEEEEDFLFFFLVILILIIVDSSAQKDLLRIHGDLLQSLRFSDLAANFTKAKEMLDSKGKVSLITEGHWLKLTYRYFVCNFALKMGGFHVYLLWVSGRFFFTLGTEDQFVLLCSMFQNMPQIDKPPHSWCVSAISMKAYLR